MNFRKMTGIAVALLLIGPGLLMLAGCYSVGNYRDTLSHDGRTYDKDAVADEIEAALAEPAAERHVAAEALVARIGTASDAGWLIARGLEDGSPDALEARMREALDALDFTNVIEADLPEGFPEPSVTGLVRIKTYDTHRKVRASEETLGPDDRSMFRELFDHISTNDIAMTAPVDMSMKSEDGQRSSMAFYYGSADIGSAGRQGAVEVVDTKPLTVVSVSVRGAYTEGNFQEAVEILETWLEKNDDRWVRVGEPRVLGYNSPFMPWFLKLSEVQIPVRAAAPLASN